MYVAPNANRPGLKALKAAAQRKAQVQAEVEATRKRSEHVKALKKVAGE